MVMLSSCGKSPQDKATAYVEKDMPKSLFKPDSYDPIETKVDSAFAPFDSPDFYKQAMELINLNVELQDNEEKIKDAKLSMSLYVNPYSSYDRDEFFEKKKEYEERMGKQEAMKEQFNQKLEKIKKEAQEKPEFIGFKAFHRYRANNNNGQTLIGTALYVFDQEIKQPLMVYDMESEDFNTYVEFVKQLKEATKQ